MKILIATDNYLPIVGGVEVTTNRIAKLLVKKGHKITIVAPSINKKNIIIYDGKIKESRVSSILTPFHKFIRYSSYKNAEKVIQKIIDEDIPDIVQIQTPYSIGFAALNLAKKYSIPIVASHHFMSGNLIFYGIRFPKFLYKLIENNIWAKIRKTFLTSDIYTTPTNSAKKYILKMLPINKKIYVISNGIDINSFNQPKNNKNKLSNNILYVGRLDREKNVDVIIESLKYILDIKKEAKLIIVGNGNEFENLRELVNQLNLTKNVTFTGTVSNEKLNYYYHNAKLFVIASTNELQSIATLEAMASGLPIVAANAVALPELVKDNVNGFLFPPENRKILAEQILKILNNEKVRQRMSEQSLILVKKHDINKVILEIEDIYNKLFKKYHDEKI